MFIKCLNAPQMLNFDALDLGLGLLEDFALLRDGIECLLFLGFHLFQFSSICTSAAALASRAVAAAFWDDMMATFAEFKAFSVVLRLDNAFSHAACSFLSFEPPASKIAFRRRATSASSLEAGKAKDDISVLRL
jgi:hypothetical protein